LGWEVILAMDERCENGVWGLNERCVNFGEFEVEIKK